MAREVPLMLLLLIGLSEGNSFSFQFSTDGTVDEEPNHIGCYTLPIGWLKVEEVLSRKQCLDLCDHRIMTYAGVQAEENGSSFNFCYCMDTLESSTETNGSLCSVCVDEPDHFCGGNTYVSVYKLAGSRPLTLLVATTQGLEEWRGNKSVLLTNTQDPVQSVDFHYATDAIFFIAGKRAYKSIYSVYSRSFIQPREFKKDGNVLNGVDNVFVDRQNSKCLFFYLRYCCYAYQLMETTLLGKSETQYSFGAEKIQSATADFQLRMLFYVANNFLHSYDLNSASRKMYQLGTQSVKTILKVVADAAKREIYIIGTLDDDQYYLFKFDYDDSQKKILFQGQHLSRPQTFDVYESYIVWVNNEHGGFVFYGCKLSPRCQVENIELLRTENKPVNDVKIYHPQTTLYKNSCKDLNCSHTCVTSQLRSECTCPEPLVLSTNNRTCQEKLRSLDNVTYLGCYPERNIYKVLHSLSWEESLHFCDYRRTIYAAVQADPSAATYNFPYCSDNLLDDLTSVNSSLCQQCEDLPNRYCGGKNTMYVYKLRESPPLIVLMATDGGLKMYSDESSSVTEIYSHTSSVFVLDFYQLHDKIFFISQNRLWSTYFSPLSKNYLQASKLREESVKNTGLAVDWVGNITYFTKDGLIRETDLKGKNLRDVLRCTPDTHDIVLDPFARLLFFVEENALHSLDLNKSIDTQFDNDLLHLKKVLNISVDIKKDMIYMIGEEDKGQFRLLQTDYSGKSGRELFKGGELSYSRALSVWDQRAVWVSYQSGLYVMYSCSLSPRCLTTNLRTLTRSSQPIYDVKIYHPQITINKNSCEAMNCSHTCSTSSQFRTKCTCPESLVIGPDQRTCQERARSLANVTYLGCYTVRNVYKVLHSLSWEESLHFCDHRKSVYAAVQADTSASSYNFSFCGNNLIQNQVAVNSSLCSPCEDNSDRYCGGNNTMSVYRLRELPPLTVLLATGSGIRMYSDDTKSITDINVELAPVTAIDYYLPDDKIFFARQSQLWRTYYSPSSQSYVPAAKISPIAENTVLSVDWVNKKIFLSCYSLIYEADLKGTPPNVLMTLTDTAEDLVMDPYNRLIFFVVRGVLHFGEIENQKLKLFENERFHLRRVLKISVDSYNEIMYMIGEEKQDDYRLVQTDYSGEKWRVLYKGGELTSPSTLSVWERQAVWVSVQGTFFTLYSCTLKPRCLKAELRTLVRSSEAIYAIKIYSMDVQIERREPILECNHPDCFPANSSKPTLAPPTTDQSVKLDVYETTTGVEDNAFEDKASWMDWDFPPTYAETSENPLPNWIPGTENVDQKVNNAVQLQNTSFADDKSDGLASQNKNTGFSYFFVILGMTIVIIFLSGAYFVVKRQKQNSHSSPIIKPASEMELTNTITLE